MHGLSRVRCSDPPARKKRRARRNVGKAEPTGVRAYGDKGAGGAGWTKSRRAYSTWTSAKSCRRRSVLGRRPPSLDCFPDYTTDGATGASDCATDDAMAASDCATGASDCSSDGGGRGPRSNGSPRFLCRFSSWSEDRCTPIRAWVGALGRRSGSACLARSWFFPRTLHGSGAASPARAGGLVSFGRF